MGLVLFLLSTNTSHKPAWNPAEQVIIEVVSPVQKLVKNGVKAIKNIWLSYFYLIDVHEENKQLRTETDALRMEVDRQRELLATHERLKRLLQFKQTTDWPVVAAQVIGQDPTGWFKSIIIDKGRRAGLEINMPVVNAYGVVGRIVSISPDFAKVLLTIDHNSAVDCLVQRSRDRGMVKGFSAEICKLHYVMKSGDVLTGDTVVTSGLGGVFPKGLTVGQVLEAKDIPGELFKDINVKTTVDFSKLEEVLVILKEVKPLNQTQEEK